MSHFSAVLKITPERLAKHSGDVNAAVSAMLAPYQENNMGDCPKEFLEWNDVTEEHQEMYQTETMSAVRFPDGSLVSAYDSRFRVGCDYRYPAGQEPRDVPVREVYTLHEYVTDYCGYKCQTSGDVRSYGYWENPNAKWDWWVIGGRWTGFFPVKPGAQVQVGRPGLMTPSPEPGRSDICRAGDIDMDRVAYETRERAEAFWSKWDTFKVGLAPLAADGKPDPWFDYSMRRSAVSMGLLQIVRNGEPPAGWQVSDREWSKLKASDERRGWLDAYSPIGRDEFMAKYLDHFCPVAAYAALDDDGWHAAGEMGWFGCSSDTPDDTAAFKREFVQRFIKAPPDTILVAVDCHI